MTATSRTRTRLGAALLLAAGSSLSAASPAAAAPPPNDDIDSLEVITPGSWSGSTVEATVEPIDVSVGNGTGCGVMDHTIWYGYAPGADGGASVDLAGSSFDTALVYLEVDQEGTVVNFGCNDDFTGQTSRLDFPADDAFVYYFQVGSLSGQQGSVSLDLQGPDGQILEPGDVQVSGGAAKAPGTQISWTVDVGTGGTGTAEAGWLTLDPPAGVRVDRVTSESMGCDEGDPVVCLVPPLTSAATASVTLLATPRSEGPFALDASWQPESAPMRGRLPRLVGLRVDDPSNNDVRLTASRRVVCDNRATARDNVAKGTGKGDILCGLGGGDILWAFGGDDLVFGGDGNDELVGGAGRDRLLGGSGGDHLHGGRGTDFLDGGGGRDTCRESADTQVSCER